MHWNNRWQLPLCAVLLLPFIACHNSPTEAKFKATTSTHVSTEVYKNEGGASADSIAAPASFLDVEDQKAEEANGLQQGLVSSSSKQLAYTTNDERQPAPQQHQPAPPTPPQQKPGQTQPSSAQTPAANPDWNKKIIKTGTLSVEVKSYAHFNDLVRSIVKNSGGYIAQEEQNQSEYKLENVVTIKVPVDQFDNLMQSLSPVEEKIEIKKITSQDVTGEVVDTRSRLEAKRAMRLRYLDLLKQAKNMEEILQVQNEINSIQLDIEAASGRVNYLTHSSAYSTIQLTYFQVLNPGAKSNDTPPGFGKRILVALGDGLAWVGEALVLVFTLWPLWLVAIALFITWRRYRASRPVVVATVTSASPAPPVNENIQ